MIPGSKGLKSHEITHKRENALLTPTSRYKNKTEC